MLRCRPRVYPLSICLALLAVAATGAVTAQTCAASSSWFTSPSFPTEIPGGTAADNCDFHQFAWQAFAAAIQPAEGGLLFDTWMPDYGVFPASGPPTPWGQNPPTPCANDAKTANGRVFRVRTEKSATTAVNPNGDQQAFGGSLADQNSQLVVYESYVNQTEYDFITGCQFYNQGCIQAATAAQAVALPPGSIEVKTAWRQLPMGAPTPANFYSVAGFIDSPTCTPGTFLLVGFHLVINTPLHPEFLWATFEHVDNAPDCTSPQPPPAGGWSFNNPRCTIDFGAPCPTNVQNTVPTQVCRVDPWGGGSATNTQNIPALNQSVEGVLASLVKTNPGLAIWQNYEMTGNLWTVNGALPPTSANFAGSILNANTTLETFAQNIATPFVAQNCFSCHSNLSSSTSLTSFKGNGPANLSHLFKEALETGGCNKGAGPLPTQCSVGGASAAKRSAALLGLDPTAPSAVPSHAPTGNR